MTVEELFRVLELAIHDGHAGAPVYFDTEARKFDYHMARVGSAYCDAVGSPGDDYWLTLHEARSEEDSGGNN